MSNSSKVETTPVNRHLPTKIVDEITRIAKKEDRTFTAVYTRLLEQAVKAYHAKEQGEEATAASK